MEVTSWGPQVKLPTQHRLTEDPGRGRGRGPGGAGGAGGGGRAGSRGVAGAPGGSSVYGTGSQGQKRVLFFFFVR